MSPRFALGWVGFVVLASAAPLRSQSRELHWRSLDVTARLDGDGRLQVRERQAMVFTGDWNGGERTFRLRWDQKLQLLGVEREDPESHSTVALTRGDLTRVDHYDFTDSTTLRWRSRLPEDPPFQETEIVYLLDYRLSNVLIPEGENRYRLDHDFAFPDRAGPIESFSLDLSFDSAWEAEPSFTGHETRGTLSPGESVVVTVPLRYRGEGSPAGVRRTAGDSTRTLLSALFLAGLLALAAVFYVQERGIGRFAPLTDPGAIDEGWLKENVFSMLPEEVGAAWDDTTAAPEVGAVLARMVSEGKIRSEVYVNKVLFFSEKNLRLKLLTQKSNLSGYERSLVDALFFSGSETDTEKIRAHYRSSGFNPASKIEGPLKQRVKALLRGQRRREISKKPALVLLSLSFLSVVFVAVTEAGELAMLLPALGMSLVFYAVILVPAVVYRKRVERLALYSLTFLAPMALLAASALYFLYGNRLALGTPALLAFTFFLLALFTSLFNVAKFRDGDAALRIRKKLASARRYFRKELGSRDPRLQDAWFPYLLAFGLGSDVDRWFRAFGEAASTTTSFGSSTGSTGLGSSSISGSSWTGGGGAFGGAGATASWAAAVGSVAAGVAAPSSSGSSGGGGGGGGGSSGGGGGGGW